MANQECLDIIRQGAGVWNQWRNDQGQVYFDLSEADLSNMDLRGIDLNGVYLHLVNLRNADLSGSDLYRAYLSEANLIATRLDNANLHMANLSQATLDEASLDGANLSRADLREAQMHKVQAEKAVFRGADLSNANLSQADLHASDLHEARVNGARLDGANLSQCDLHTLDLEGMDLREADLGWSDLSGVNLSDADLQYAHLQYARLSGANLDGANLNDANLEEADLNSAYLGDAHMRRAYLRCANLSFADLSGAVLAKADLSGADLLRTNFTNTNLSEAEFAQAAMGWTIFANVDLSTAQGLSIVRHHGPISLDVDTLFRSASNISESFLRAANLPVDIIARLLNESSADLSTYCICASSIDQEFAARLQEDMQKGGKRCWYALVDLKVGEKLQEQLDELLRLHDRILLVQSAYSLNSEWMTYAVKAIQQREQWENRQLLLSIRLDNTAVYNGDAAVSARLARNMMDFSSWRDDEKYQKALSRLLRTLDSERSMPAQRAALRRKHRSRMRRSHS